MHKPTDLDKKEHARLKRVAAEAGRGIFDKVLQIFPLLDEVGIVLETKRRTRFEIVSMEQLEACILEHAPEFIALVRDTPVPACQNGHYRILAVGKHGGATWSIRPRPAPVEEAPVPKKKPRNANLAVA